MRLGLAQRSASAGFWDLTPAELMVMAGWAKVCGARTREFEALVAQFPDGPSVRSNKGK